MHVLRRTVHPTSSKSTEARHASIPHATESGLTSSAEETGEPIGGDRDRR